MMARLMSLYIEFDKKTYLALISVRQKEKEFLCQVRYVENSLHYKIPAEFLVFDQNGVLQQPDDLRNTRVESLMGIIIQAITKRLQTA